MTTPKTAAFTTATPPAQVGLSADTLLSAAALKLTRDRPYLGTAFWSLRRISTVAVPTMAVDSRWRLYYNPETVLLWSVDEIAGVLYHEVCHLLREHLHRGVNFSDNETEHTRWNFACDMEINDDIAAENQALPEGAIYPKTFHLKPGLLAEEYYHLIRKEPMPERWRLVVCGGRCGSCVGGPGEVWEIGGGSDGVSDGEAVLIRRGVALSIQQASRSRGNVPGHWERWAEKSLAPPVIDWRRELASQVRRAILDATGASDYRYGRPARRQSLYTDLVLPSLRQPTPNVAVIVDTSGSMSDDLLTSALGEVAGILKAAGLRSGVTVLSVDAQVHVCRRVFRAEQVTLAGGGGTDMGAGLARAETLKPRPDAVVVLTDGYTPWPATAPGGMKVVVGLLGGGAPPAPEWARSVRIDPPTPAKA